MPPILRPHATAARVRRSFGTDPVTVAALLDAGITPGQLRAAVAAGTLRRVRRGVLVAASGTDPSGLRVGVATRSAGLPFPDARPRHREACAAAQLLSSGAVVATTRRLCWRDSPRPGPAAARTWCR